MARAYLLSHGARIGSQPETFVPAGKTISFFSEYDENTMRSNGLAALNNGDIKPTETLTGPCAVANYYHSRFEDEAIAQHLATESSASGGKAYYVGSDLPDPSWLCPTPQACTTSYPQHAAGCKGIFASLGESEIYSVACRGLAGGNGKGTEALDGSGEYWAEMTKEAGRVLAWTKSDPAAAMQYWESLTDATRQMLAGRASQLQTWAENYYAAGGDSSPAAVLEARRYIEAYGEETFVSWVDSLPQTGEQYKMIMADPGLTESYDLGQRMAVERTRVEGVQERMDDQAAAVWQPSAEDLRAIADVNQRTVKAAGDGDELDYEVAGFVMLIGADHPGEWYTWARGEADYASGRLTLTKGGVFSKGGFTVSGCPGAKQGVVESALNSFSDKDVTFG